MSNRLRRMRGNTRLLFCLSALEHSSSTAHRGDYLAVPPTILAEWDRRIRIAWQAFDHRDRAVIRGTLADIAEYGTDGSRDDAAEALGFLDAEG